MRLDDYFKGKQCKLCDETKLLIFDNIKNEITKQSIFSRLSFYVKVGVYSVFLLFLFGGIFLFSGKNLISKNISTSNGNIVEAGYVGKVVYFTGSMTILDGNKKIDTNVIKNNNLLLLGDNTTLRLQVNNGIVVNLVGPAKVKLFKYIDDTNHSVYILNILDGNYVTVKSNIANEKIIIKSKFLNIESNSKFVDIKYENKKGISIIENNGGDIFVKKSNKVVSLGKKEKLILLTDNQSKYISKLFDDNYKKIQMTQNGDVKVILSSSKLMTIKDILDKNKVILAVGRYVLGKLNSNEKYEIKGKKDLFNIIDNLYTQLNIDLPKHLSVNDLNVKVFQLLLANLISEIDAKYVLPGEYTNRLKVMLSYMVILDRVETEKGYKFNNLSDLIKYVKLNDRLRKILLQF